MPHLTITFHALSCLQVKIISSQARCGANPARIVRALAHEAAERDVPGKTALRITLSLARLDPRPTPSFATSPRIGASRRVSAPCEDAAGIWQMAPTSGTTDPRNPSPPQCSDSATPPINADLPPPCTDASGHELSYDEDCAAHTTSVRSSASGELTAEAVIMPGSHAKATHEGCDPTRNSAAPGPRTVRITPADADEDGQVRLASTASLCAMGPYVCQADSVDRARRPCASEAPLGGAGSLDELPRLPSNSVSTSSREFGAGLWWRMPVTAALDVPENDSHVGILGGMHGDGTAVEGAAAGSTELRGGDPRRRALGRMVRSAMAGAVFVAACCLQRSRAVRRV